MIVGTSLCVLGELSASGIKAKLSAHFRAPPNKAVRITAGSGLYLLINPGQKPGTGVCIFPFTSGGRRRDMGLGVYPEVGLADARLAAFEARGAAAKGQDPILSRSMAKAAAAVVTGSNRSSPDTVASPYRRMLPRRATIGLNPRINYALTK